MEEELEELVTVYGLLRGNTFLRIKAGLFLFRPIVFV
jgi:hypothetical protein